MRSAKLFGTSSETIKQRKCKGEDRIGERFEPRDFAAPHAKAVNYVGTILHAHLAQRRHCLAVFTKRDSCKTQSALKLD